MAEPTDPGTQPSLISTPFSEIEAPRFTFPDGARGVAPSGPFGPKPSDIPTWEQAPRLGYAGFPGNPRTLTIRVQTPSPFAWTPHDVQRPCVLLPYRSGIVAATVGNMRLHYMPGNSGLATVGADRGIVAHRCAPYLWSPGRWFLLLIGGSDTSPVDFLEIPAEDRNAAESISNPEGTMALGGIELTATVAMAAATATTLVEQSLILLRDYVRVVNVGAGAAFLAWSGTPTAASAFSLPVGGFLDFFGPTLPVSRLRGFSTAGTTIEVWAVRRHCSST